MYAADTIDPRVPTAAECFGYKTAWFAVRSEDYLAICSAIGIKEPKQASWSYGVNHAYNDRASLFLTPVVQGWTLIVGTPLLYIADFTRSQEVTETLSCAFGEAQFFASMRVTNAFRWTRGVNGVVTRDYYEGDGEHSEHGELTDVEQHLKCFSTVKDSEFTFVTEETVLEVAEAWSVNPAKLHQMNLPAELGYIGDGGLFLPEKSRESVPPKRKGLWARLLGK